MRNFKSDNRSRDRRDSPRRSFSDRDSRRPLLHDAVCDECGKDCQVPFRPSGDKPIYCSDCFEKKGGGDSGRSRDRRSPPRRSFGDRDSRRPLLHDAVCDECGKDCQVPFRPSGERPIYCSDCFEKKGGGDSGRSRDRRSPSRRSFGDRDRSASQFIEKTEILNTKLDTIISLLSPAGKKKPLVVKKKSPVGKKKSKLVKSKAKKNKTKVDSSPEK